MNHQIAYPWGKIISASGHHLRRRGSKALEVFNAWNTGRERERERERRERYWIDKTQTHRHRVIVSLSYQVYQMHFWFRFLHVFNDRLACSASRPRDFVTYLVKSRRTSPVVPTDTHGGQRAAPENSLGRPGVARRPRSASVLVCAVHTLHLANFLSYRIWFLLTFWIG
jgi:hypothetical protein